MAQDRFRAAIQALSEDPTRAYYGLYPYKVKDIMIQEGKTMLQLKSEIDGLPDLIRIPWVSFLAKFTYEDAEIGQDDMTGTRLLVGFIAGDPSRPVAMPLFLSGVIGDIAETTTGQYTQNVGNHTTNASEEASDGNITENAIANGAGASGGNITMNASASGSRSSGGNIAMNALSSGDSTSGGNISATSRGGITLRSTAGVVTIQTQGGAINITATGGNINLTTSGNVVMNSGQRNVAREGDTIELTSWSGTAIDTLGNTLTVTMSRGVGRITSATNRVKVP